MSKQAPDAELLARFRKYVRKNLSENSAATYLHAVESALKLFPKDPLKLLLQEHLTHGSKRTYQAALRHWAIFTENKDLQDQLHSPELKRTLKDALRVEHRTRGSHDVQPFSKEEEKRIFTELRAWRKDDTLPAWQWPAISMMFMLGLRAGADLAWLARKDVESALRSGVELHIITKGGKERALPAILVLDELKALNDLEQPWEILADLIVTDRAPDSTRKVANAYERLRLCVKKLADDVDIPQKEMHTHRFRHTAAQRLYAATKDIKKVKDFLGHSEVATTMGYLKKNETAEIGEDLLAAMRENLEE